jgi:CRP-like cAMP-binding protein
MTSGSLLWLFLLALLTPWLSLLASEIAFALNLGRWLLRVVGHLEEVRLLPGERVEHRPQRVYIVTRGTGQLLRDGPGGHDILLRVLMPGQILRDGGTLLAETTLEMLALPANTPVHVGG